MIFNKKVTNLLNSHSVNSFLKEGLKISNECLSGNGALKYSTSNDAFVDNFAAISHFKAPRKYSEVAKDMQLLWSINPLLCLKLALYIRLITRKSVINLKKHLKTLNIQKGAGLKNEGIMRMLWIAINHPKTFKRNIPYFIAAGSYKDIFQMLSLDLQYHGWNDRKLDWNFLYYVISSGLNNPNTSQLVRKYLPTIRTNSKSTTLESQANTLVGRWIAHRMFKNFDKYSAYKCYRHLKSEGIAHSWQQSISKQLYDQINFDKIAGRALSLLVNSKFLKNHELEDKYFNWISNKEVAKYTGYVFELFKPLGRDNHYYHIENYKESTINAQFNKLIETGSVNSGLLVVRDTSASMMDKAIGCNVSSFDIGKSLALYFSYFLKGVFANSFAEFSNDCKLHYWKGSTPVDKYINDECEAYGSTNFQSIIDLFIKLKNNGVPESDFPTGLLLLSDGEFDPHNYYNRDINDSTNFNVALDRLKKAGFSRNYVSNFKIIMWDIPNNYYRESKVKFEDFADAPNFYYLSGYDGSIISFIMDGKFNPPKNAKELFMNIMNQDILNELKVID